MESIRIEILNPKAKKLLKELAELNLIRISKEKSPDFESLLKSIREKVKDPLSPEDIRSEVEAVRKSRYKK